MVQYIDKVTVSELKDLYEDIDKCIGDLVLARSKHDQRGISDAHWKMETLMVNTQQVLSYILQHLEVKEVDLDYIKDELDRVVKIYKPNGDFGWGTLYNIATHFFELGLNTQRSSIDFSNIDDTIKDMGIDPYSKEAKLFKEAYFIALDKYIAQKGE